MNDASAVETLPAFCSILAPPDVPPGTIQAPPGNELFLVARGVGSQNYIRLLLDPPGTGSDWVLFAPQATLFDDGGRQIGTHFASSAPPKEDPTTPVTTWQDDDNSAAWATREKSMDSPDGSIPWLLLKVVATRRGKAGGPRLASTTYIQRVHTTGGVKPPSNGTTPTDVGSRDHVPYRADYYFYRRALSA